MSIGFSVGDLFAATQLARQIWTTCFSKVSGARLAYNKYGEQIRGLGNSLHSLWQILSDHEQNLQRRGRKLKVETLDLAALAGIVGDFMATLKKTECLLNKFSIFKRDGKGYVAKIRWSIDAEEEVHTLTQDCAFHIAKIQFVTEPLKMKLLMDLSEQIEDVRSDIMAELGRLGLLIRNAQGDSEDPLSSFQSVDTISHVTQDGHQGSVDFTYLPTSGRLEERFEETLRNHPRFRSILPEIPLQDWTEAAAWWIDNGTGQFNKQKVYGSQMVPAELYLNLLKAAWLLTKCETTMDYRRLDKNSLWCDYICGLLESISTEIKSFSERDLSIPDEESLLRLPDECFLVWLNNPEKDIVLSIRDERPGEEKILQLNLETSLDPNRFSRELLIFRKDEETLRLCDTTENFENGSRSSEEFIVLCAETQLIALYVTGYDRHTPILNVMMKNKLQSREYSFRTVKDLHDFQRAMVGSQVMFDQPGCRDIICAPLIGSGQQGTNVRIQMWLDKPLTKQPIPFSTPNLPPATRTITARSISSSGSSSNSTGTRGIMEFRLPTAPRLIVYYKARERWVYIQIPMEESLIIKPKRCCGNFKRLFSSSETCCRRIVLEPDKGSIETLLFKAARDEPDWTLDMLQANVMRAKRNGEKALFKYISIEFADVQEKLKFSKAFEDVKKLRKAQRLRTDKMMQDAKRQVHLHRGLASSWVDSDGASTLTGQSYLKV